LALVVGLLGSCGLDCADGTVARIRGNASGFGNVLDRIGDLTLSLVLAGALGVTALGQPGHWLPISWQPFVLVWSLVPKQVLSVISWLKDTIGKQLGANRPAGGAARLSMLGRAKRLVGNVTDDAPYRFGVGLSWGLGFYFEFALIFHTVLAAVTALYLFASRRSFGL
jgi:phosphatidylglycerophosphate synthase